MAWSLPLNCRSLLTYDSVRHLNATRASPFFIFFLGGADGDLSPLLSLCPCLNSDEAERGQGCWTCYFAAVCKNKSNGKIERSHGLAYRDGSQVSSNTICMAI